MQRTSSTDAKKKRTNRVLLSVEDETKFWQYFEYFLPFCTDPLDVCSQVWIKFQSKDKNYSLSQIKDKWTEQAEKQNPKPVIKQLMQQIKQNKDKLQGKTVNIPEIRTMVFLDSLEELIDKNPRSKLSDELFNKLSIKMYQKGFKYSTSQAEIDWCTLQCYKMAEFPNFQAQIDRIYKKLHQPEIFCTEEAFQQVNEIKRTNLGSKDDVLYWKYFEIFLPRGYNGSDICEKVWEKFLEDGKNYTLWQIREKWLEQIRKKTRHPLVERLVGEISNNAELRNSKAADWDFEDTHLLLRTFFGNLSDLRSLSLEDIYEELADKMVEENCDDDNAEDKRKSVGEVEAHWLLLLASKSSSFNYFKGAIDSIFEEVYNVSKLKNNYEIQQLLEDDEEAD